MKFLLPVVTGVMAAVAGNLANPHISNVGLLSVMGLGIAGIHLLQTRMTS